MVTIRFRFRSPDDVEARGFLQGLIDKLGLAVFFNTVTLKPELKLQEVFEGKPPRKINV